MPIGSLEKNKRLPVVGKIRLGVRNNTGKNGHPQTVPYFVLKDAPQVEAVYGPNPHTLDIIFPHRDREIVLPTWYRLYGGGYRDEHGDMVGGELYCRGTGADDGGPGWASHFAGRDPVTRVVPRRPCLEQQCPDFSDKNGVQQCKAGMKVIAMLPKVTTEGVFTIDTTSWESMGNFISVFDWALSRPEYFSVFTDLPFVIYREETVKRPVDAKGIKRKTTQYIMKLRVNHELYTQLLETGKIGQKHQTLQLSQADADYIDALPMEDHYLTTPETASVMAIEATKDEQEIALAEELLKDPEIQSLFTSVEKLTKPISVKHRIIGIRKYLPEPDAKQALINALEETIRSKQKQRAAEKSPKPDVSGII